MEYAFFIIALALVITAAVLFVRFVWNNPEKKNSKSVSNITNNPDNKETFEAYCADMKTCFKQTYNNVNHRFRTYIKDECCNVDIAAALMVTFDYAILCNGGKEQPASLETAKREALKGIHPFGTELANTTSQELDERVLFYAEFLRGKQPRCDFWPHNDDLNNGLLRVVMALSDIIYNPLLSYDYDCAPYLIIGLSDAMRFNEVTQEVTQEFVAAFNYATKISRRITLFL